MSTVLGAARHAGAGWRDWGGVRTSGIRYCRYWTQGEPLRKECEWRGSYVTCHTETLAEEGLRVGAEVRGTQGRAKSKGQKWKAAFSELLLRWCRFGLRSGPDLNLSGDLCCGGAGERESRKVSIGRRGAHRIRLLAPFAPLPFRLNQRTLTFLLFALHLSDINFSPVW